MGLLGRRGLKEARVPEGTSETVSIGKPTKIPFSEKSAKT